MGKDNFGERVTSILEAHYHDEAFGVVQLAEKLFLSRSQLHRKLGAMTGKSASCYIREFRLNKSHEFLTERESTVSEVAYACGFGSPSYFNTCFSKHFGFPPGEVRNRQSPPTEVQKLPVIEENAQRPDPGSQGVGSADKAKKAPHLLWGFFVLILAGSIYFTTRKDGFDGHPNRALDEKSIAVLPFENYTPNPDMEAVCERITDDLSARLSAYPGFDRVISRTSTYRFRGTQSGIRQIAKALGVSHILRGQVQPAGTQLKVSVQLLSGGSERQIWSQDYIFDWNPAEVFKIQAQLASSVAHKLGQTMPETAYAKELGPPTGDSEAFDNYVQGVYQAYRLDEKSLINAEVLLTRAIELDSGFAEAYSALGYVWSARGFGDVLEDQKYSYEQAKYYFCMSRELDSTLWQNELYALQAAFYLDWDFHKVEAFLEKDFLNHVYSRETSGFLDYLIKTGRFEEALQACEASIQMNPLDAVLYSFKARALWFLGRSEEALEILQRMDRLYDKDWFYLREAAHSYFMMGAYERSFQVLDRLLVLFEDRSPTIVWLDLMRSHMAGNAVQVETRLQDLLRAYDNIETGSPAWYIGLYYSAKGDSDAAFDWLECSFERFDVELTWLREEPLLTPFRDNPRYTALVRKVGFPK